MESLSAQELGRLYLERGDVIKAVEVLEPEAARCLEAQLHLQYLDVLHLLFRCYVELLDFQKIEKTSAALGELVEARQIELTGKTYYILALCASAMNKDGEALELCQKALSIAVAQDDKETICYILIGIAICYYHLDRLNDSLKEIYNLQVFMNVMDLPQVRLSAQMLKGQILRKLKKYDQALEVLWESYDLLQKNKNLYAYQSLLLGLALTYKEADRLDEARSYLLMAQKSIDKVNLRKLSLSVENLLSSIGEGKRNPFDIVFNSTDHSVHEKHKGRIDFNNQFILMDLLKLLLSHPGVSFSKEQLVKLIWKQSYNPAIHDNKIYVTIKRLRLLIEPEIEKPRYIFRSKNGYYFNKESKIFIEEETREKL